MAKIENTVSVEDDDDDVPVISFNKTYFSYLSVKHDIIIIHNFRRHGSTNASHRHAHAVNNHFSFPMFGGVLRVSFIWKDKDQS